MKRFLSLITSTLFILTTLFGQNPGEALNQRGKQNPIEKIYLHLDRETYLAGETMWFKAYFYSDFLPSDNSTVLFVELLRSDSKVISKQTLPISRAVSQGQFELLDTLTSGNYIIRAYTATMLNADSAFVYKRRIAISGKEPIKPASQMPDNKIRLEFFPEGGNFVAGQPNTVAFRATEQNGLPKNVKGFLKNSSHEIITEFSSQHDGMGMFDLDAKKNAGYYVELQDDPQKQRFQLPEPKEKGIVFRLLNAPDGIHFEIFQQKNDPVFQAAYMIGQMQHHVVFKQDLKQGLSGLTGVINTKNLSSGVLHITVFNKDGMPLAERLSFVNNKEYMRDAQVKFDTTRLSPRGKNHYTLAFKDSVTGSFSISVIDPDFGGAQTREENIFSRLLLTADLNGYIHNPTYYFSSDDDSVKYAIDLLMMINGWRRFKWEELIQHPLTAPRYKDPAFVTLTGKVSLEGTKKPFANGEMLMYIIAADSSRSMQLIKTDANGYYHSDSLIFFGRTRVLLSDIKGKKSKFVDVKPGSDSLGRAYMLPGIRTEEFLLENILHQNDLAINKKLAEEYKATIQASGSVLSEIVVKARKKTAIEELDEKYATGAFSGDTRKTFDLVNSDDAMTYPNIFDYLQVKVPGFVAGRNADGEWQVYYRQMATISSMGNQGMDIFLDEVLTDPNTVAYISPNQIAYVKVYSTFVGSTGGGAGGALAVYLKKGEDYIKSTPSSGEIIVYNGFSIIKEFYSPDYSVRPDRAEYDRRLTLYWKPDIFIHGKDNKFPIQFYNNDRSKRFKIVVEGMTADGKMLMIEKTIER